MLKCRYKKVVVSTCHNRAKQSATNYLNKSLKELVVKLVVVFRPLSQQNQREQKAVAEVYGITRMILMSWIHNFKAEATQGLTIKPGRGRKRKIGADKEDDIRTIIKANPNIYIDELKLKVMEKYDVTLSRSTIHRLIKRLAFSYITPRPRHHKAKEGQKED
mgnify:CR=1 FL=1